MGYEAGWGGAGQGGGVFLVPNQVPIAAMFCRLDLSIESKLKDTRVRGHRVRFSY